jgi:hypothetical protein
MHDESRMTASSKNPGDHFAPMPVGFFPIFRATSALYSVTACALAFLHCRIHDRFAE